MLKITQTKGKSTFQFQINKNKTKTEKFTKNLKKPTLLNGE